ncbi:MAG TPA: methyltransferase domain-containing protein [Bryobacteraceae bacterium]|jgi:SAM-dependent methyltransferase|nr:methyltransferase domain-containing protein [Bryobacteraceae bacterium]
MTAAAPFDTIAARYDDLWTRTPVGRAQRDAVWLAIDPLFQAGDRVLDVGCGTGEDAVEMESRGVRVHAIDASARMVEIAGSRGIAAHQLAIEQLQRMPPGFDGILSNFGAVNCAADTGAVAAQFARLLPPGGYAAVCVLNRICAWEIAWFGVRLQGRAAFRRLRRGGAPSSLGIKVHYPSACEMRRAFAPWFHLVRSVGIGVLVPPSYVKLPSRAVRWAARLEAPLRALPACRAMGDHRLYLFRRRAL